jgi:hypothetical protein
MAMLNTYATLLALLLLACGMPQGAQSSPDVHVADLQREGFTPGFPSCIYGRTRKPLNEARVPFAIFLNKLHRAVHPQFADEYLGKGHGVVNSDDHAAVELVIDGKSAALIRANIIRSSGDAGLDAAALTAFQKALPVTPVDPLIVSADGRIYLTWELYRNPDYACSTYFAHPYMLTDESTNAACLAPPPDAAPASLADSPKPVAPILAPLKDQTLGDGDCGCVLRLPGSDQEPKIFSSADTQIAPRAAFNIHGTDVYMTRQAATVPPSNVIGTQYTEIWKSSDVEIRIDYTITKNCEAITDDCEGTWFSARVTASSQGQTQTLDTQGYCGC